ncbi:putative glycoside hydrolase [Chitinimonas lacunae]|uniref:Glycoside hydrolase n=1 Tax=Chitinimonas lacunae TaxID=1963018 RepID=A0ABV8MNX1_9NEIS
MISKQSWRAALVALLLASSAWPWSGQVIDSRTKAPIAGAIVTVGGRALTSGADGRVQFDGPERHVGVRAPGYQRHGFTVEPGRSAPYLFPLQSFRAKGIYLSFYGIGSRPIRQAALDLLEQTELNTLVVDVKGDRAMIPYASRVEMAERIGARRITTVRDMPALIGELKQRNIYLIARVVVFKDTLLATAHPEWAIRGSDGNIWRDREKLAWVEPFHPQVWRYVIDIAEEAARMGFDEIQFDYVRFPDTRGLRFSKPNTRENRVEAISGFLAEARRRLTPYNVFVSADVFGYVAWNIDDTEIGQQIERLGESLDYISPMLYPSGFHLGIPGYRNPVATPFELIDRTLAKSRERSGLPGVRFRPWLQAFRDYGFDRREFGEKEIRRQIDASEKNDSAGWLLWNPRNRYSAAGLKKDGG